MGPRLLIDQTQEEKPKRRRRKRRKAPVEEAQPLKSVSVELPPVEPAQLDPEVVAQLLQMQRPQEPLPEPPIPEPTTPVEDRLMQHLIQSLGGAPEMQFDDDDMPYLLRRFLRMGR
jgi:hypothetical protein